MIFQTIFMSLLVKQFTKARALVKNLTIKMEKTLDKLLIPCYNKDTIKERKRKK